MKQGAVIALGALSVGALFLLAQSAEGGSLQVPDAVRQWEPIADDNASRINLGLDPEEILAIIWNESTGNPNGSNPDDPSWGLMGVTELIAEAYGGFSAADSSWRTDGAKNIRIGAAFLADLKNKYSASYPTEWVQTYNIGETKFRKGIRNSSYSNNFFAHLNALKAGA